ncbi:MAG TPA: aminotransferase class V-fold PLP-dependent enzyme, partial [Vicinamibacterales bacterium]|nr:aminotransferase class V-fold PLP-dependent enzyme [Vicinamibacterales bacterium]
AYGGGHEGGLRPGTPNVPAIVGLGEACDLAREEGLATADAMRTLRNRLYEHVIDRLDGVWLNGCPQHRHPGNLNLTIAGIDGEGLLGELQDVAFSAGSACSSSASRPSHVITALGHERPTPAAVVRLGLGRATTADQVEYVAGRLVEVVRRLRRLRGRDASRTPTLRVRRDLTPGDAAARLRRVGNVHDLAG